MEDAGGVQAPRWRDKRLEPAERVADLIGQLTLREKVAQLCTTWIGVDSSTGQVAPHQGDMDNAVPVEEILAQGLGQLTRPLGTDPVDPRAGVEALVTVQRQVVASNRLGIPAVAHEECLAGLTAWQATCYPVPLSWGATFNPAIVRRMADQIGHLMRSVGSHQGLAPVLDVARDLRWGRIEETIGEDPYLVGTIATAYVQGLEGAGMVATLKHFAGYSASRSGRNLAPAVIGRREMADVILPPFEMALAEGGARSVMSAYTDWDGVPASISAELLTDTLRGQWGFQGTVVADYFAIGFLKLLQGVAGTWGDAARLALSAGVDVEMPNTKAFGDVLVGEVEAGRVSEALVDRALTRVLTQKCQLGLLDADWAPTPSALVDGAGPINFDPPEARRLAGEIARQAVVLVKNDGTLPLDSRGAARPGRIAVIGPTADDPYAMLGCYSFPIHRGQHHPELPIGVEIATVSQAIAAEFPDSEVVTASGCTVSGNDTGQIADAADLAASADLAVLVVGDRAGLFGNGTSGEGCDAGDLALPGVQGQLLEAVLGQPTPCVVVALTGRTYALGSAPDRAAAIVQAFFPGEEGGVAIAQILSGEVNPSGRLPVSIPACPGAQPATYLGARLAHRSEVSNIDPTPAYWFGHGLSYTATEWCDFEVGGADATGGLRAPTDGSVELAMTLANPHDQAGVEVVQLYLHRPVASVVQPVVKLIGFARVDLEPRARVRVEFTVPVELTQFTGLDYRRIVEPGTVEFRLARSAGDPVFTAPVLLTGPEREVGFKRSRHPQVRIHPVTSQ
ncbi:MAG: glycoside hydrolase family 3 C-terminal domain-containing protein [Bifidobacteriaceae bacterium]|jgi:beta-xylosidase|nr:glycoside hydrolase family 3 C-terminal domain-containing protein [Bifidobacteriaceae bacterium]